MRLNDIAAAIQSVDCGPRMGGECYPWAIAIQRVLLRKGVIVVAMNDPIWKHSGRLVGHAAVRYRGRFWDSERETNIDVLESWGSLDPEDEDYAAAAGVSLEDWRSGDDAYDVGVYEMTATELVEYAGVDRARVDDIARCLRAVC
jgi:hypothetical protein